MSLEFWFSKTEDIDCPDPRSVYRRTWGKFNILVSGHPLIICHKNGMRQNYIETSIYPIALWLLENWTHIYTETLPPKALGYCGQKSLLAFPDLWPWLSRHNLMFAEDMFDLPDINFFRREQFVAVECEPDFLQRGGPKFVDLSSCDVQLFQFNEAIKNLANDVANRLYGVPGFEAENYRQLWLEHLSRYGKIISSTGVIVVGGSSSVTVNITVSG